MGKKYARVDVSCYAMPYMITNKEEYRMPTDFKPSFLSEEPYFVSTGFRPTFSPMLIAPEKIWDITERSEFPNYTKSFIFQMANEQELEMFLETGFKLLEEDITIIGIFGM